MQLVDIESGKTIFEQNPDKLLVPASNAKIFSTALALTKLGPDYRFTTFIVSNAALSDQGVLQGDLVLVGGGDPNLSSRHIPYDSKLDKYARDLMKPIRELARQVVVSGVRTIQGNIVGDDTRYVRQPWPRGWSVGDVLWGYGAPVSALSFNDSVLRITILPGRTARQRSRLRFNPAIDYFAIENHIRTAPTRTVARRVRLNRDPGSRAITLSGDISIRSRGRTLSAAVDDPALFAAMALRQELEKQGVKVEGETVSRHTLPHQVASLRRLRPGKPATYSTTLARRESAPLAEVITIVNKLSVNLHAEMLLRETAYHERHVGSIDAGLAELENFLGKAGLESWEFDLSDASGLSRRNLVSASAGVKLLTFMWNSPQRQAFLDSLPIAGRDGTLDWRFSRTAARGLIRAKTGTLSHVTALSGYAFPRGGKPLAFSILVNNFNVQTSYIRNLVDRIAVAMLENTRPPEASGDAVTDGQPHRLEPAFSSANK